MQKRLLLSNLRELHEEFRQIYPNNKIGFSKFCSLRPKWCVTVGTSGTHSVYVCTIHQNVKLYMDALNTNETYHDLIAKTLCCPESKNCLLGHCDECPNSDDLRNYLYEIFDDDNDLEVTYKQWKTTDRANLLTLSSDVPTFIDAIYN